MVTETEPVRSERPAELGGRSAQLRQSIDRIILAAILVVAVLHFPLVFRINIGWDEFRYLSDIYAYRRGDIANALQTVHVHLFGWLPHIGGTEIDQVIVARGTYYLLLLGSCVFIYRIASTFLTRAAALFAVLVFLSYSAVVGYGTTFRFDGLSVFLLLASLALVISRPASTSALVAAAGLAALAVMVTIKSAFYLPTLLLVLVIGSPRGASGRLRNGLKFMAALVVILASIYYVHGSTLPSASAVNSAGMLERAGSTGLNFSDPLPRSGYLLIGIIMNPATWLLLVLGVGMLLQRMSSGKQVRESLILLALLLPLGSLVIYRNAFPYYYVFLIPVAAVVAGVPFDELIQRHQRRADVAALVISVVLLLSFGVHYSHHWVDETKAQRQLVEAVHRMFPDSVPYIDPNSMISSFPKVGFFMSSWGLEHYHTAAQPIFENLLEERQPVFLLAHYPLLLNRPMDDSTDDRLLPEDGQVLRENYVHHWGTVYVAGKQVRLSAGRPHSIRTMIPGPYTLEADAPVLIDGQTTHPGEVAILGSGRVTLQAKEDDMNVTLRWGEDLYQPAGFLSKGPIFRGFFPCGSPFSNCRPQSR